MILFIALISLAGSTFVGHLIGSKKGRAGWAWGLLLGWLGVIIVACLSDKSPQATKLSGKQLEVADLEADVRLAELRQRQAALALTGNVVAPVEAARAE